MGTEKSREDMIKAAEAMRAFYQELGVSDETTERAVKIVEEDVESGTKRAKK